MKKFVMKRDVGYERIVEVKEDENDNVLWCSVEYNPSKAGELSKAWAKATVIVMALNSYHERDNA